jgi:hypothetical protein
MGYFGYVLSNLEWPMGKLRTLSMATTASSSILFSGSVNPTVPVRTNRRRQISPQAGQALVVLGHAIEYLTDEFVHQGGSLSANNQELQAIQLLMALNREVYFECPEVLSLGARFRGLLGFHTA